MYLKSVRINKRIRWGTWTERKDRDWLLFSSTMCFLAENVKILHI